MRSERSDEHSRQSHSAHHTEHVTVHYPWHPLHGQAIVVQRSVRQGRDVWLCAQDQRTAAIPVWMTDRAACAALSTGPALVSVAALTDLAALVTTTRSTHDRVVDLPQEDRDATSPIKAITHAVRSRGAGPHATGADRTSARPSLADLLLASTEGHDDEERDDAREDHR